MPHLSIACWANPLFKLRDCSGATRAARSRESSDGSRRSTSKFERLTSAAIVCVLLASSVCGAEEFKTIKGLNFSADVPSLTLDLYLPADIEQPVPCIITIQGGGFRPQNGQQFKAFAEHLANNGFAAALISYRGRPEHHYAETLADVNASVKYIRRVSEKYKIDPRRIGATGRSAGGTLAGLLAVRSENIDDESRIQAAVCFAGVFDFVGRFTQSEQLQPNHKTKILANGEWIGAPFARDNKDWLAASPITHVTEDDPPILFLHAKDDSVVPWPQSRDMHKAMRKAGVDSEITIYSTGGHGVHPKDGKPMDEMTAFFRKHLR